MLRRVRGVARGLLGSVRIRVVSTGSAWAAATATPTPTPTIGVASERGIVSFLVFLLLTGGLWLYLRRRG